LIGGSIAKALKNSDFPYTITAYDKPEVLAKAKYENVIDEILANPKDTISADVIFICLPLNLSIEVFKELAPLISSNTILTDVSGVKLVFQKEWEKINSAGMYIGGHPMTGKEKGGYENSDPLLFENSVYIVTHDLSNTSTPFSITDTRIEKFKNVLTKLGANILFIPAKQHDVIAASVSHLPQLLSVALVNTASLKTDEYNFLDLAAGGFRDMTRIASSNFNIWEDVINQNQNQILTAIEKYSYELEKIKNWVSTKNNVELEKYFIKASKHRNEIPKNTKGFLTPVFDIFVFVKDEPGVISKISSILFVNGINIKDIELLKIREGDGGTFRMSFETEKIAQEAKIIISELGFKTKD
ncbi:MAG: prephenate dehydrogenase/arogenate dehydrogenase family protein, partial [Melioribacteraceae bacterium]